MERERKEKRFEAVRFSRRWLLIEADPALDVIVRKILAAPSLTRKKKQGSGVLWLVAGRSVPPGCLVEGIGAERKRGRYHRPSPSSWLSASTTVGAVSTSRS